MHLSKPRSWKPNLLKPKELEEDDPRLLPSYATSIQATPPVSTSSDTVSIPQLTLVSSDNTPEENTTLLPVISWAEQCKSNKESCFPFVSVKWSCENGTFDEENRFQHPITRPAQIPSKPPLSDSAFEFYNNNVKVSINQCWEMEKEDRAQSSSKQEGILYAHAWISWTTIAWAHQIWWWEIENLRVNLQSF